MSEPRRAINFFGGGIPVGVMLATLAAPPIIARIEAPMLGNAAMCDCRDLAARFTSALYYSMGIGGVLGGLGGLALWYLLLRRRRSKAAAAPAA